MLQGTLVKDADAKGWGNWRQDKEQLRPARPAAGILTPPYARQEANPPQFPLLQPEDRSHLGVGWLSCRTSASRRPPAKRRAPDEIIAIATSILQHICAELPRPPQTRRDQDETSHPQEGNRVCPHTHTHQLPHQARPQATTSMVPPPARGRCCRAEPPRPGPWQQATPIVCLRLQPGGKEQGRLCSQIPASKERRIKGGERSKAGEGRGIRGLPATGEAEASDNRACLGKLGSAPAPTSEEPFL